MKNTIILLAVCVLLTSNVMSQKILLEERFNENDRGWNLGDDKDVVRKIENGKFILECNKYLTNKGGYWIRVPDFTLPATNYSISVTTEWIGNKRNDGAYNAYGFILADYYFMVYADGDRRLLKWNAEEKKYETLVDWSESSAIKKYAEGENKWEITYKDGKAGFYANGQMLYKKEIVIPEGTYIKLYVENSERIKFDNIIVKSL